MAELVIPSHTVEQQQKKVGKSTKSFTSCEWFGIVYRCTHTISLTSRYVIELMFVPQFNLFTADNHAILCQTTNSARKWTAIIFHSHESREKKLMAFSLPYSVFSTHNLISTHNVWEFYMAIPVFEHVVYILPLTFNWLLCNTENISVDSFGRAMLSSATIMRLVNVATMFCVPERCCENVAGRVGTLVRKNYLTITSCGVKILSRFLWYFRRHCLVATSVAILIFFSVWDSLSPPQHYSAFSPMWRNFHHTPSSKLVIILIIRDTFNWSVLILN